VPGKAASIFKVVAQAKGNVDMIVQNVSTIETGRTDISFTLPKEDAARVIQALQDARDELEFEAIHHDDQIGKIALVGGGMRTNVGVSATFFKALSDNGINLEMISTSEIRISVVTRADQVADAVRVIHSAFGLDADDEAVIYAGTGR
ncbi:ACT domain-containing protein, partial [Agrococcus casei]